MNSSKSSPLALIFLIPLFVLPSLTTSQPAFLKSRCRDEDDGNYTETSTYKTNLHTLLSTISSKPQINYGFIKMSVGQDMDVVHGIALCRADILTSQCHACLEASTTRIIQDCPNQKDAVGWYDMCMIWYSNENIFNGLIPFAHYNKTDKTNKPIDLKTFNHTVKSLLVNLTQQAASGDTRRKFATGEVNVSSSIKIYALAQCTPNLQHYDCINCLKNVVIEDILAYCCFGNQAAKAGVPNCNIRYQNNRFYRNVSALPPLNLLPVLPPPPPPSYRRVKRRKVSKKTLKLVLIPISAFLVLLSAASSIVRRLRSRSEGDGRVDNGEEESSPMIESWLMNFATVKAATNNFSDDNKLGGGAFGSVYKGTLSDGQAIAVKRLSKGSVQGEKEFKNEALVVAKLHHRNLVRFLGFCLEGDDRLLVYEYLSNNSLDFFLYDPIKRMCLDWQKRYKIIEGIARGLLYLHEESRLLVVHRDLKPSNVLLDAEMNPKISDFGLARLFGADQTHANTTNITGTHGYMAPEYVLHGQFSIKSDVFSFGVLVLEIISGQKANDVSEVDNGETLLSLAWKIWSERNALKFVDPKLSNFDTSEVLRCINIGLLCVQENATQRPIMSSVVMMLNSSSVTVPVPSRPAFPVNIE